MRWINPENKKDIEFYSTHRFTKLKLTDIYEDFKCSLCGITLAQYKDSANSHGWYFYAEFNNGIMVEIEPCSCEQYIMKQALE